VCTVRVWVSQNWSPVLREVAGSEGQGEAVQALRVQGRPVAVGVDVVAVVAKPGERLE